MTIEKNPSISSSISFPTEAWKRQEVISILGKTKIYIENKIETGKLADKEAMATSLNWRQQEDNDSDWQTESESEVGGKNYFSPYVRF